MTVSGVVATNSGWGSAIRVAVENARPAIERFVNEVAVRALAMWQSGTAPISGVVVYGWTGTQILCAVAIGVTVVAVAILLYRCIYARRPALLPRSDEETEQPTTNLNKNPSSGAEDPPKRSDAAPSVRYDPSKDSSAWALPKLDKRAGSNANLNTNPPLSGAQDAIRPDAAPSVKQDPPASKPNDPPSDGAQPPKAKPHTRLGVPVYPPNPQASPAKPDGDSSAPPEAKRKIDGNEPKETDETKAKRVKASSDLPNPTAPPSVPPSDPDPLPSPPVPEVDTPSVPAPLHRSRSLALELESMHQVRESGGAALEEIAGDRVERMDVISINMQYPVKFDVKLKLRDEETARMFSQVPTHALYDIVNTLEERNITIHCGNKQNRHILESSFLFKRYVANTINRRSAALPRT